MSRKRRNIIWIAFISMLTIVMIGAATHLPVQNVKANGKAKNYLEVQPPFYNVTSVGENFTISVAANVTGDDSHGMFGYAFKLIWNPTLLNATTATRTPPSDWGTNWADVGDGLNRTAGSYQAAVTALGEVDEVNGTFTLVTLNFTVLQDTVGCSAPRWCNCEYMKSRCNCTLKLEDTGLSGEAGYKFKVQEAYDGVYEVGRICRDIAITNVEPSVTEMYRGGLVDINVQVDNKGEENETFTLAAYCNDTKIGNRTIHKLLLKQIKTFTFTWNTTESALGNYTITAVATTVPNESDTTDNAWNATNPNYNRKTVWIKELPADAPWVEINPPSIEVLLGETFDVNVTIYGVTEDMDLAGWDFKLWYNTTTLDVIDVTEGPFLEQFEGSAGTFFKEKHGDDDYNSTSSCEEAGLVSAGCIFMGGHTTPSGNGTLATITFNATQLDGSSLGLYNPDHPYRIKLSDIEANIIPCNAENGYVTVIPEFPKAMLVPLLLITTLIVVLFIKKTHSPKHKASMIATETTATCNT